jgi:penicillin-binding protein 2
VEVNAAGQVVRVLNTVDAKPGYNIFLTLDLDLQAKARDLLEGLAGAVVAMDPNNGEILALASSPSFDLNVFVSGLTSSKWRSLARNPFRPLENKAIQGEYPPGSTYKIVTAIAGLEEGVIDENTTFFCPGFYRFGRRIYRCWKRGGHGNVNVTRALAESCDVFFYNVGHKLGVDRLAWYARACGLGKPTGIELGHEAGGLIPTASWKKKRTGVPWQRGETLSVAIGQGYDLATPLQNVMMISAIANGGLRYQPMILKRIETAEGRVVKEDRPKLVGRLPISPKTLALVRQGLWRVVNGKHGTARICRVKDIEISGKTGTSQVVGRKKGETGKVVRPAHRRAHAWFVAYAPSDKPRIAISVVIEHGEHGSSAASPIARELIKTYLGEKPVDRKLVVKSPQEQPDGWGG